MSRTTHARRHTQGTARAVDTHRPRGASGRRAARTCDALAEGGLAGFDGVKSVAALRALAAAAALEHARVAVEEDADDGVAGTHAARVLGETIGRWPSVASSCVARASVDVWHGAIARAAVREDAEVATASVGRRGVCAEVAPARVHRDGLVVVTATRGEGEEAREREDLTEAKRAIHRATLIDESALGQSADRGADPMPDSAPMLLASRTMPYRPLFEELRALVEGGATVVPVTREVLADALTPVLAYATASAGDHGPTYLLESAVGGEKWARYSFVGVDCDLRVQAVDGGLAVVERDGTMRLERADDPWDALRTLMARYRPASLPWLPRFWGGAVGYVPYDAARRFEPSAFTREPAHPPTGPPELSLAIGGTLLIFDGLRQTLRIVVPAYVRADQRDTLSLRAIYDAACARVDAMAEKLASPVRLPALAPPVVGAKGPLVPPSSFDEPRFIAAVETAQEHIRAGDIFQVVLSQRFRVPAQGAAPFDVYRALRVINPSPYMYFLRFPEARIAGASPETLVRVADGIAEVRPIAGTRRRGIDEADDRVIEQELRDDPKENAEHVMLVDLGRNDVGRISAPGTVRVTEKMLVERYSHVMHLVSNVRGELAKGRDAIDVLRATFPAGTLSGAPKVRAMQIIDALEPERRGIYGGAIGYLGWDGAMDVAIAIRTVVEREGVYSVQAGAGIVHASDPSAEYEETLSKARAALAAIEAAREKP